MYLDAGSELNVKPSTEKRFNEYFSIADDRGLFAWTNRDNEERLSRCSVIDRIYPPARGTSQFEGGTLIFKNTQWSLDLITQWKYESMRDNYYNVNPQYSEPCCEYFGSHLAEQSVLSCILKKEGIAGIHDEASWYLPSHSVFNDVKSNRDAYPLFSARNKTGKSLIDKDCIAYKEHIVCIHGLGSSCAELARVR
jgi:hypothetical protein